MPNRLAIHSRSVRLRADPQITPERLRSFAEAARLFFDAAPWKHFGPGELVKVMNKMEKGFKYFNVMGGGGQEFGLSFFPSPQAFRKLFNAEDPNQLMLKMPLWGVTFDSGDMLPEEDLQAWKRLKLPRAKNKLYPLPVRLNKGNWERPNAAQLKVMEDMLRAMAVVRANQVSTPYAQWQTEIQTPAGPIIYGFKLLDIEAQDQLEDKFRQMGQLLVQLAETENGGLLSDENDDLADDVFDIDDAVAESSPQARARRLIDQAYNSSGPEQLRLARLAIEADPHAVDAYVILGDHSRTPRAAADFYRKGIQFGEESLGAIFPGQHRSFLGHDRNPSLHARLRRPCRCADHAGP